MSNCLICGKPASIISVRCADGLICSNCARFLPSAIKPFLKHTNVWVIRALLKKWKKNKGRYRQFIETASYGSLHIDEQHGLIALCDRKEMKNGRLPDSCTDIFSMFSIEDYSLSLESIDTTPNSVKVIINFHCSLNNPEFQFKSSIKNATCYVQKVGEGSITYHEPPDLTLFRSMFNQAFVNVWEKYDMRERHHFLSPHAVALTKAKALFMVDDDYTEADIRKQRNRLAKVYHPDENEDGEDLTPYMNRINEAYNLLKEALIEV